MTNAEIKAVTEKILLKVLNDYISQLETINKFFIDRMDADHDGVRSIPNDAMRISSAIDEVIERIENWKDKQS